MVFEDLQDLNGVSPRIDGSLEIKAKSLIEIPFKQKICKENIYPVRAKFEIISAERITKS